MVAIWYVKAVISVRHALDSYILFGFKVLINVVVVIRHQLQYSLTPIYGHRSSAAVCGGMSNVGAYQNAVWYGTSVQWPCARSEGSVTSGADCMCFYVGYPFFFCTFANLRKATVSHVCPHELGPHWTDFHEIWRVFYENLSRKFKFHENLTSIAYNLHEDQCTFLTIRRSVLLRMRNVSGKSCRENKHI